VKKKLTALALLLALALILTACESAPVTIVGSWECEDFNEAAGAIFGLTGELTGMGFLGDLGSAMDIAVVLHFFENGTYRMDMEVAMMFVSQNESYDGTYSYENGVLYMDGQRVDCTLTRNKLTLTEKTAEGFNLRLAFKRQ